MVLSAENYSIEELAAKVKQDLSSELTISEAKKDFLVLELAGNTTKNQLLKKLSDTDIDIEHFGRYEPSLNDIFVAVSGDEDSAKDTPA